MYFSNKKKWLSLIGMTVCIVSVAVGCGKIQGVGSNKTVFQEVFQEDKEEVTRETVAEEPMCEVTEDMVDDSTSAEGTVTEETITEEFITETSTTEASVTEEPTTEEPTTEEPTTEAPTVVSVQAKVKGTYYVGDTLSAADFAILATVPNAVMT